MAGAFKDKGVDVLWSIMLPAEFTIISYSQSHTLCLNQATTSNNQIYSKLIGKLIHMLLRRVFWFVTARYGWLEMSEGCLSVSVTGCN